jgi:hypothetical protein
LLVPVARFKEFGACCLLSVCYRYPFLAVRWYESWIARRITLKVVCLFATRERSLRGAVGLARLVASYRLQRRRRVLVKFGETLHDSRSVPLPLSPLFDRLRRVLRQRHVALAVGSSDQERDPAVVYEGRKESRPSAPSGRRYRGPAVRYARGRGEGRLGSRHLHRPDRVLVVAQRPVTDGSIPPRPVLFSCESGTSGSGRWNCTICGLGAVSRADRRSPRRGRPGASPQRGRRTAGTER